MLMELSSRALAEVAMAAASEDSSPAQLVDSNPEQLVESNPEQQPWWTENHAVLLAWASNDGKEKAAAMLFNLQGYPRDLSRQGKKCIRNHVNKAMRLMAAPKHKPSQAPF